MNAKAATSKTPPEGGDIAKSLVDWSTSHPGDKFHPEAEVAKTLNKLATEGTNPFYSGVIAKTLVDEMSAKGVAWNVESDMKSEAKRS